MRLLSAALVLGLILGMLSGRGIQHLRLTTLSEAAGMALPSAVAGLAPALPAAPIVDGAARIVPTSAAARSADSAAPVAAVLRRPTALPMADQAISPAATRGGAEPRAARSRAPAEGWRILLAALLAMGAVAYRRLGRTR